jgi:hypothetical protein
MKLLGADVEIGGTGLQVHGVMNSQKVNLSLYKPR